MQELFIDLIEVDLLPLKQNEYIKIQPVRLTDEIISNIKSYHYRLATCPNDRTAREITWTDTGWAIDNTSQGYRDLAIIVVEGYRENIFFDTPYRIVPVSDLDLLPVGLPKPVEKVFSTSSHYRFRKRILRRHLKVNTGKRTRLDRDHFNYNTDEYSDHRFNKPNRRSKHVDPFEGEWFSWRTPTTSSWKHKKCRHQWQRHS